jgi:hypothetical protein
MDTKNWRMNLGVVLSRLYRMGVQTEEAHDDVSAWYAPSECHRDVNRGYEAGVEKELERLFAEWGVRSIDELEKEYWRRVQGYLSYYHSGYIFGYNVDDRIRLDEDYRVETA